MYDKLAVGIRKKCFYGKKTLRRPIPQGGRFETLNPYEQKKNASKKRGGGPAPAHGGNSHNIRYNRTKKPPQRRRAVLLGCGILALLLVILLVTAAFSSCGRSGDGVSSALPDDSYDPAAGVLDEEELKDTLLKEGEDAGQEYIDETLFIGDSNTYRMMVYGFTTLDNDIGLVGMGLSEAWQKPCVKFQGVGTVTIPEAVKILQPRRVVLTFGTNNTVGWSTETFIAEYRKLTDAIHKAYPYADILINAIPPVSEYRQNQQVTMTTIDKFNAALAQLAKEDGYKFINSAEALKDPATGFAKDQYTITDGIHLTKIAFQEMFGYIRTHSLITEDTRPKPLKEIPKRAETQPSVVESDPYINYYKDGWPEKEEENADNLRITFGVNDPALGSLSGELSQTIAKGAQCTAVEALPAPGAVFDHWECTIGRIDNVGDPLLVFSAPYEATEDIYVKAVFVQDSGPALAGVRDRTIEQGYAGFNPLEGVTAFDSQGNTLSVTFKIYVKGDTSATVMPEVMVQTPGTYVVTYTAVNAAGVSASASAVITVTAANKPPVLSLSASSVSIEVNTPFDPLSIVSASDAEDGAIALSAANYTITNNATGALTGLGDALAAAGSYTITYTVRDSAGAVANAAAQLTVTAPPEIPADPPTPDVPVDNSTPDVPMDTSAPENSTLPPPDAAGDPVES